MPQKNNNVYNRTSFFFDNLIAFPLLFVADLTLIPFITILFGFKSCALTIGISYLLLFFGADRLCNLFVPKEMCDKVYALYLSKKQYRYIWGFSVLFLYVVLSLIVQIIGALACVAFIDGYHEAHGIILPQ